MFGTVLSIAEPLARENQNFGGGGGGGGALRG